MFDDGYSWSIIVSVTRGLGEMPTTDDRASTNQPLRASCCDYYPRRKRGGKTMEDSILSAASSCSTMMPAAGRWFGTTSSNGVQLAFLGGKQGVRRLPLDSCPTLVQDRRIPTWVLRGFAGNSSCFSAFLRLFPKPSTASLVSLHEVLWPGKRRRESRRHIVAWCQIIYLSTLKSTTS